MIVRETKLLNGTLEQYQALDDAIRTAQFIRNKALRYWMDNQGVVKADLYKLCKDLAIEFDFALKLNSAARQASAERAWAAISSFYKRCKKQAGNYLMIARLLLSRMALKLGLYLYSAIQPREKTFIDLKLIVSG